MLQRALFLVLATATMLARQVAAQDPAEVEALAPLLMAEDRRDFDPGVFERGLDSPDPLVRQTAVLSIGRIGDRRGTLALVPLLSDRDMGVVTNTFFSLGLIRDSAAVDAIIARLRAPDSLGADAVGEAATALARIGGATAAGFIGSMLSGGTDISFARQTLFIPNALQDGWRLGPLAPAQAMLHYASDTSTDLRWRTIYSLGRLRAPSSGHAMLNAIRDQTPSIREIAAKWLMKQYADTSGLAASAVKTDLIRAIDDDQPGVRVNALESLATFADSTVAGKVIQLLSDADPNVQVAAASALGAIKGSVATHALDGVMDRRNASWPLRRAALLALAHADPAMFAHRATGWFASRDVRDRLAALQAWGSVLPAHPEIFQAGLNDVDPRVQAAALEAWRAARGDTALAAAARARLRATDPGIRAAAASTLRNAVSVDDLDPLISAWRLSARDPGSDARLAVLGTLHALVRRQPIVLARLDDPSRRDFLQRPDDPVVRAEAARSWPEVAERWGSKWPIDTHRSLDDYRGLVRKYLLATDDPQVTIDVEGRGSIQVELLAREAPLTVANFLQLVDRHYFDGDQWHRVVPNFVVQDGDPTGTGNGGPGWSIRDEINRERYVMPMLGMALSGPDTGGSQWFINLSAEPHLDGQYTIFGKVTGTFGPLDRIVQGDVIRSIHR